MSGFASLLLVGGSTFTPVTHSYSSGTGATETVPAGATNVVITLWGGGGGGARDVVAFQASGAASGAYVQKTLPTTGGTTFIFTVGFLGAGRLSLSGDGNPGGTSSISSLGLSAGGGGGGLLVGTGAIGGTASGGDTNINGNNSLGFDATGMGAPNGGGNVGGSGLGTSNGSIPGGGGAAHYSNTGGGGGNGAPGEISFAYT